MPAFSSADELKKKIVEESPEDFFNKYILGHDSGLYDGSKINFCAEIISEYCGIKVNRSELVVVGSAKLGFGIHDKYKKGRKIKKSYRSYDHSSDVDLSICSRDLFENLWSEVSRFALSKDDSPYRILNFGDYLVYGWYRSDQLKNVPALSMRWANSLNKSRSVIRRDHKMGNPRIDFGVFYSLDSMRLYQEKSIVSAKNKLELSI